ncbi:large subunit terminase [Stenotrophomonas phage B2]|nr:large subunit terminase [Stenotrophomonas phage B2]
MLRRRRARSNLHDFITFINPDYIVSDFSRQSCAEIDRFLEDMVAGKRPVLIFGAPPQHGKSDIVSRYLPAYALGKFPNLRVGGLSYAKELASDMNLDVQRIMTSEAYALLFPDSKIGHAPGSTVQARQNSTTFGIAHPKHRGSYIGQGVGGPLTGKPLDLGIIDDPIKNAKEALSQTTKDGIWNWYTTVFLTRLSQRSGQIIMATRWAEDDLSGRVIKKYGTKRVKELVFQAISKAGKALVPALHSLEKLLEIKGVMSDYFWSALYQQSPKPLEGSIFKPTGLRHYRTVDLPKKFDQVIISLDATFKDLQSSDYVVFQVWGKLGANSYLLHQVRDRLSFTKTCDTFKAIVAKYPQARRKLVEDKANGPAIIDTLKSKISGIVPVEPDGSKVARAHAMTAEWEAGNVWIPHPDEQPWVQGFVDEVTSFPAAANDDQVDAMSQAIRDLYGRKAGFFG